MKKKGWLKILCNLDLFLASIALLILTMVTFVAVIMRYVLRTPLLWQEEAQAFCQVWLIFLGGSIAFRQGSIVAIEMVVDGLPEKRKKIVEYIVDFIVIFTLTFLLVKSQQFVALQAKSNQVSSILRIPNKIQYGIAPYGIGLMIISYLMAKYLPKFVKDINIDVSNNSEEVAEQ